MIAEQREQLKDRIRESEPGHVVDGVPGDIILFPAAAFDEEELPDVDIELCVIEEDGEPRVPVPRHFPQSWRGGLHLASPHHLAAIWTELPASTLRDEVKLREEKDLAIPPIAEQRLEREVYR